MPLRPTTFALPGPPLDPGPARTDEHETDLPLRAGTDGSERPRDLRAGAGARALNPGPRRVGDFSHLKRCYD